MIEDIEIGNLYKYCPERSDNRIVVVIQFNKKSERFEVSSNLVSKVNPFWVYHKDLVEIN